MSVKTDEKKGNKKAVSTIQAAKMCNVSVFSIQRWFDSGLLKGGKLPGGKRLIDVESLQKFIEEHKIKTEE